MSKRCLTAGPVWAVVGVLVVSSLGWVAPIGWAAREQGAVPASQPVAAFEVQANTYTRSDQSDVSVAADDEGYVLSAWCSRRQEQGTAGIFAQLFDPLGRKLGTELHVNQHLPSDQRKPAVAFGPDGHAWVVWQSYGQDGDQNGIVARVFGWADGADRLTHGAFGPRSGEIGVNMTRAGHQSQPTVAVNTSGEALIVWSHAAARGQQVMARLFGPDGRPRTDELLLTGDSEDARTAVVAALPNGFAVCWSRFQDGQPGDVVARVLNRDGSPSSDVFVVSEGTAGISIEPSVDAAADGRFVVAWMNQEDDGAAYSVIARAYAADGSPATPPQRAAVPQSGQWLSGASVAVAPDGRFAVSYNVEGQRDPNSHKLRPAVPSSVLVQRFTADGQAAGPAEIVKRASASDSAGGRLTAGAPARRSAWTPRDQLVLAWSGETESDAKSGAAVTLLVPRGLTCPTPEPVTSMAAVAAPIIDAEAQATIPPVFDPNFVPEPPDAVAGGVGTDFGFLGIQDTGWYPPDPDVAVGPSHVVCVVNGKISFFTRAGVQTFTQSISGGTGFWGSVGATFFVFDPVALWDPHSERFIAAAAEHGSAGGMFINLAVSDDDDPNGTWHKYRFDTSSIGDFIDFPNLGVDAEAIYVNTDYFDAPTGNWIHIIDKAPCLVGSPTTLTPVQVSDGFLSLGNVLNYDADAPAQYFITSYSGSAGQLRIEAIRDPLGTPIKDTFYLSVPTFAQPPDAAQLGTSNRADTIDFRIKNGVYRNGYLYATHNVGESDTARVRWYEIQMNGWPESGLTPDLRQSGTLNLGNGQHNWFADVAVDEYGNMGLAFNRSSSSQYISVERTYRKFCDSLGTLNFPVAMQESTSAEQGDRWGDYAGLQADPNGPFSFWSFHEYRTTSWRTWVGNFVIEAPTGDFDEDGDIDLLEFSAVQNCQGDLPKFARECDRLDLNLDCYVGTDDWAQTYLLLTGPTSD